MVISSKPNILLINPPVYDFAAYDFWLKPYGLIRIGGQLRSSANITLFDFMDRRSPHLSLEQREGKCDEYGRGSFYYEYTVKPIEYQSVPSRYRRYGTPRAVFQNFLKSNNFDFVLITSAMTYWYLGIKEVIADIRKYQQNAKIVLGGIYATLCSEHAKSLDIDLLIEGNITNEPNKSQFEAFLDCRLEQNEPPFWKGYSQLDYGIIKLNDGCPLNCSYCSSKKFYQIFQTRKQEMIWQELETLIERNVKNIAFYDDALLISPEHSLIPFLNNIEEKKLDLILHTPNALHVNAISEKMAVYLKRGGFKKIFLGFESISDEWQGATGGKTNQDQLKHAVANLKSAGFNSSDITAYLIIGHPKQTEESMIHTIEFVGKTGIRSMLAEFSPIPGTPDGEICSELVDMSEPLFHNSSFFSRKFLGESKLQKIKDLSRHHNNAVA